MAVFLQDEASNYVTCPYDDNHIVKKSRFSIHLLRCKSENREQFENCPFNANHIIERGSKEQHFKVCAEYHALTKTIESQVGNPFLLNIDDPPSRPREQTRKLENLGYGLLKKRTPIVGINNRVQWELLGNPDTFEPLNMFQIQKLQKSDRKKYNAYLMRYNRKMASLGRPTLSPLSDEDDLSTLCDSGSEDDDLVDLASVPNGRAGVMPCAQFFDQVRARVASPLTSSLVPPRSRSHSVASDVDPDECNRSRPSRESSITRSTTSAAVAPITTNGTCDIGALADISTIKPASTSPLGFVRKRTPIVRQPQQALLSNFPSPSSTPTSTATAYEPVSPFSSTLPLQSPPPSTSVMSPLQFSLFRKLSNDQPRADMQETTLEPEQLAKSNCIQKEAEEVCEKKLEQCNDMNGAGRKKQPLWRRVVSARGDEHESQVEVARAPEEVPSQVNEVKAPEMFQFGVKDVKVPGVVQSPVNRVKEPEMFQYRLRDVKVPGVVQPQVNEEKAPDVLQYRIRDVKVPGVVDSQVNEVKAPDMFQYQLRDVKVPRIVQSQVNEVKAPEMFQFGVKDVKIPAVVESHVNPVKASEMFQYQLRDVKVPRVVQSQVNEVKAPEMFQFGVKDVKIPAVVESHVNPVKASEMFQFGVIDVKIPAVVESQVNPVKASEMFQFEVKEVKAPELTHPQMEAVRVKEVMQSMASADPPVARPRYRLTLLNRGR